MNNVTPVTTARASILGSLVNLIQASGGPVQPSFHNFKGFLALLVPGTRVTLVEALGHEEDMVGIKCTLVSIKGATAIMEDADGNHFKTMFSIMGDYEYLGDGYVRFVKQDFVWDAECVYRIELPQ